MKDLTTPKVCRYGTRFFFFLLQPRTIAKRMQNACQSRRRARVSVRAPSQLCEGSSALPPTCQACLFFALLALRFILIHVFFLPRVCVSLSLSPRVGHTPTKHTPTQALFRRAWAHEALGQAAAARTDLKAALVLEPLNPQTQKALARVDAAAQQPRTPPPQGTAAAAAAAAALAKGQVRGKQK